LAGPTRFELLVGSNAFWARAAEDIGRATRRVLIQAMTFEGDDAGHAVAAAIAGSAAADRRVLVDAYTRWVVSDRFVWTPGSLLDRALRAEVRATRAMFSSLAAGGVGVRETNPVGPFFLRYPARNHKKLIVTDDVAYIGGINFSDHNFAWPDFMLRLEGARAAETLAADFEATFAGAPHAWRADLGDLQLASMDGRDNIAAFGDVAALIEGARTGITIISPYLTFPFTEMFAAVAARGVAVELITPWASNKVLVRNALVARAARAGFAVKLLPGMTHLKGLLIDGTHLVLGSSNFDFVSLAAEEELMAVITDPVLIADFRARVIAPAALAATAPGAHSVSPLHGWLSQWCLMLAQPIARAARHAPRRAIDWKA